ncbi:unnamed protein product [Adineta ricciae]|uniref:Uncharacterized protein n=1 Tax=Adineta ricciae TaxID=249248 RepID=A0A814Q563_ADIRI|nr:unnamed protein product [Adineta ricciae]CAF1114972.1 unnamed protein product [Adineta ricciae]
MNLIGYFSIFFFFYPPYACTIQCHVCETHVYDHPVTSNDLSFPTEEECHIVLAHHGCYILVEWYGDGRSVVSYNTDQAVPYDSVTTIIERQMTTATGKYETRKSIGYGCKSSQTACNDIDHIKRLMDLVTFPILNKIEQFDYLLTPMMNFNAHSCTQISNMKNCSQTNRTTCRQCLSTIRYSDQVDICSSCVSDEPKRNYFIYRTTFRVDMGSRVDEIKVICQNGEICSTTVSIEQIRQNLTTELNSWEFHRSVATTMRPVHNYLLYLTSFIGILRFTHK